MLYMLFRWTLHTLKDAAQAYCTVIILAALLHTNTVVLCSSGPGSEEHAPEGGMEILECWHLSADELTSLMRECLLPLAQMHASLGLAQSLQQEGATGPLTKAPSKAGKLQVNRHAAC